MTVLEAVREFERVSRDASTAYELDLVRRGESPEVRAALLAAYQLRLVCWHANALRALARLVAEQSRGTLLGERPALRSAAGTGGWSKVSSGSRGDRRRAFFPINRNIGAPDRKIVAMLETLLGSWSQP